MQKTRKKRTQKRKQIEKPEKGNEIETYQSNLHSIDEMQTFYIKNWDTEENPQKQKVNLETSLQLQRKKLNFNFSDSLNSQPAYPSSLPRLKPLSYSHQKLKIVWKPKESISQRLLPHIVSDPESNSLKRQVKEKKTFLTSRINLEHMSPFLQNKIKQQTCSSRESERRNNLSVIYPKKRTQAGSKLEMKFKEFKMGPKDNEIGYILKKHKTNYKSQVVHHRNEDQSKVSISSNKILPINLQRINQNRLIAQSLKHYLNMRQTQKQNQRQHVNS